MLLVGPAGITADEPAVAAPAKISFRLSEEIRASLPKFVPPAPPADAVDAATDAAAGIPADPDLLLLPKLVVREKRPPGHDPDVWLREKAIQQKAMALYKGSMTDLEWALNCWFIPFVTPPPSVRARAAYENGKKAAEIGRLNSLIKVIGLSDEKEAAKLRRAMDPEKLPKDN